MILAYSDKKANKKKQPSQIKFKKKNQTNKQNIKNSKK
jgi:hypothetical protein